MKTLAEIMPSQNLFKKILDNHPEALWLADAENFDIEYFQNYSGDKTPSNLLVRFAEQNTNRVLTDSQVSSIANILWSRYGTKWNKIIDAMMATYNPIENYSMVEETKTSQDILTEQTGNSSAGIYGFNSSKAVPSGNSEAGNETHITADGDNNIVTHTRSGNIGVTTSQQMQQSSIDLWNNWNIVEQLFTDIDKVITLPIYTY